MSVNFGKRTIKVQGTDVELDTKDGLPIADISKDMDRVAAQMAWWGSIWAAAEKEKMEVEGYYRKWKANATQAELARDPKAAEWKVRAAVEGSDKFLEFKRAQAQAEENVTLSKAVFQSYDKKGNMLQSRGAIKRGELAKTGMSTPVKPKSAPSRAASVAGDDDDDEGPEPESTEPESTPAGPDVTQTRIEHLRDLNKSKKNKQKTK